MDKTISVREKMLKLLKGETLEACIIAPLVERDFAASVNDKEWCTDVVFEDYLTAAEICGYDPIFEVSLDYGKYDPKLQWNIEEIDHSDALIRRRQTLKTPRGTLTMVTEERKTLVPFTTESVLKEESDYRALEWYFEKLMDCCDGIREEVESTVRTVDSRGLIRLVAGNTFELSFMTYPEIFLSYLDYTDLHRHLMDVFFEAQKMMIDVSLEAGADLIYAAGVASEYMSPKMFEETFLPYLKAEREYVHDRGGYFYYHSCGFTKKFIELGFYDEIAPDLFETLSPPPSGEIADLRRAREQLGSNICTKGNLDTEIMRSGSREDIVKRVKDIIDATWGYRHMVALADTVLWGTPPENVQCMVDTAKAYHQEKWKR